MQHKIYNIIYIVSVIILSSLNCHAGEVEMFIPEDNAKEFLIQQHKAIKAKRQEDYLKFKRNAMSLAIHENNTADTVEEVISDGGAIVIDNGVEMTSAEFEENAISQKMERAIITDTNSVHENVIIEEPTIIASSEKSTSNITVHENSVELSNFIVHENSLKSRYSVQVNTAKVPDQHQVWSAAASQASLLFSSSAKERDQATKDLIKNGVWLNVAKKLLASDDSKVRINGIQLLKSAALSKKYKTVSTAEKMSKLSDLLITSLNDSNSKVRFISALILSKLTGDNFNYNFNSDPQTRQEAITAWDNHIKTTYGS